MNNQNTITRPTEPEDFGNLYRRAFADYGTRALWNMRPMDDPSAADGLAITRALRTHGGMEGRRWRNKSKDSAVPLTRFQSEVLRVLAAERSPDSYIAGGVALNREGPRISLDIDVFQDSQRRLETAVEADATALIEAGFKVSWNTIKSGKREAEVAWMGERMPLEWVADSAFRFFPAQRDELFGYVLHPADLATNKASAAADRREPRDIVDLLTIHQNILPLGAVVCAAIGRFPGQSPEEMLSDITRHSRFDAEEFRVLATEHPLDVPDLHRRIRSMIEDADRFISRIPSDAVGFVFLDAGKPVQPDLESLERFQRHAGALGGVWPSSPEISRAMLQRLNKDAQEKEPAP